jgi:hypothetical protein
VLVRFHVPFDAASHVLMLGGEPQALAVEHAEGEDPGITFWATPAECSRCSSGAGSCRPGVR